MKIEIWKIENRKSQSGKVRSQKSLSVKPRPATKTAVADYTFLYMRGAHLTQSMSEQVKFELDPPILDTRITSKLTVEITNSNKC